MKPTEHTLLKSERLYKKKDINALFEGGNLSFAAYPFRAVFRSTERDDVPARILVSIPKHRLRHAVDRNRMKRQGFHIQRSPEKCLQTLATHSRGTH